MVQKKKNTEFETVWREVLDLASTYPSPHNSQPIKCSLRDDRLAIYFDTARGLFASEWGELFSYVTVGVFIETLVQAAAAYGHEITFDVSKAHIDTDKTYLHECGVATLNRDAYKPDEGLEESIRQRHTSRLPYEDVAVKPEALSKIESAARRYGHRFHTVTNESTLQDIYWLYESTLIKDLGRKEVRKELAQWMRYTEAQAVKKGDGMTAKSHAMNPVFLKLLLSWPWLANNRVSRRVYKHMYKRHAPLSAPQLGFFEGPFSSVEEYVAAGRLFTETWLLLSEYGYCLQPFGTVVANKTSLQKFYQVVDVSPKEDKSIWIIFKMGKSKEPPKSHRLPIEELLIKEPSV